MCPIDTTDFEVIQQLNTTLSEGIGLITLTDLKCTFVNSLRFKTPFIQQSNVYTTYAFEQFYFVQSGFSIVRGTLNHFQGHKSFFAKIFLTLK